jgi:hypothetical protein
MSKKGTKIFDMCPELHQQFEDDAKHQLEELKNNKDNSKKGWWRVNGIRHSALVWTDNAVDAVKKATNVQDWECPSVAFIGVELPDVIEL